MYSTNLSSLDTHPGVIQFENSESVADRAGEEREEGLDASWTKGIVTEVQLHQLCLCPHHRITQNGLGERDVRER